MGESERIWMFRKTTSIYVQAAFPFVVIGSDERSCPLGRLQAVNGLKKGSTTVAAALMAVLESVPVEIDMFSADHIALIIVLWF